MPTFNPNNALMQDAVNGKVPSEQGTLVLKEFMTQSAVTKLAKYEEMTKPEKEFTYLASWTRGLLGWRRRENPNFKGPMVNSKNAF